MVHSRLHEKQSNPNPHINFITALPTAYRGQQDQDAVQLLRALAAQVRPVMKAHGFVVNSLEEYEYNKVFAGRNWEAGETVELVLRNANGSFASISYILSTLCHELAHIKHMNHGPAFQALWKQISAEVRALQQRGYYGDGYWSAGTRLADSARIGGQGFEMGELPQYMCGGAQPHTKPTRTRRLRRRRRHPSKNTQTSGPSNHTGRQTAKRRKAGTRVRGEGVFVGQGVALVDSDTIMEEKGGRGGKGKGMGKAKRKEGTGFRKQAGSKRAREERAVAAERRLRAVQASTPTSNPLQPASPDNHSLGSSSSSFSNDQYDYTPNNYSSSSSSSSEYESDPEPIQILETDEDRLKTLLDSTGGVEEGKTSWGEVDFEFEFGFEFASSSGGREEGGEEESLPRSSGSGVRGKEEGMRKGKGKEPKRGKSKRKQEDGDEDEDIIVISSDSDSESGDLERERERKRGRWDASKSCDVPSASASGSTYGMGNGNRNGVEDNKPKPTPTQKQGFGLANLLQTEIDQRKKESLGMAPPTSTSTSTSKGGGGRKLGTGSGSGSGSRRLGKSPFKVEGTSVIGGISTSEFGLSTSEPGLSTSNLKREGEGERRGPVSSVRARPPDSESQTQGLEWVCRVCTLINEPMFLACSACATPRS